MNPKFPIGSRIRYREFGQCGGYVVDYSRFPTAYTCVFDNGTSKAAMRASEIEPANDLPDLPAKVSRWIRPNGVGIDKNVRVPGRPVRGTVTGEGAVYVKPGLTIETMRVQWRDDHGIGRASVIPAFALVADIAVEVWTASDALKVGERLKSEHGTEAVVVGSGTSEEPAPLRSGDRVQFNDYKFKGGAFDGAFIKTPQLGTVLLTTLAGDEILVKRDVPQRRGTHPKAVQFDHQIFKRRQLELVAPGEPLGGVPFGTFVHRADIPERTVYLVASASDGSGDRVLVTLPGGSIKRVPQDTRVELATGSVEYRASK